MEREKGAWNREGSKSRESQGVCSAETCLPYSRIGRAVRLKVAPSGQ